MQNRLLLVLLVASSTSVGQSRFNGTWQMQMDTLQFSGPPEDYLFADGMYHCKSCAPKVDVKADGADHEVTGYPYDTLAVHILNDHAIKFTMKKASKPFFECVETVSHDGKKMTEEFANTMEPETVTGKAGFTRLSDGPAGSHLLSGQWRMDTVKNETQAGTLTTFTPIPDGFRVSDGSQSYEAKLDGKDYPVGWDRAHSTVSLKLIDEYTIEKTDRTDGRVIGITLSTVAKDGDSMKVEVRSMQRGQTMTFTAVKLH